MSKFTDKIIAKIEEDKKRIEEDKKNLGSLFKEFFTSYPEVSEIVWTQYAPHWNDGEACTFRVRSFELHSEDDAGNEYGYGDESSEIDNEELWDDFEALENYCQSDPNLMELLFDSSVMVTATLDGFTVDEYEHD